MFKVYMDDNSHYKNEKGRYLKGTYKDCETALKVCREIVDEFLTKAYSKDKTENQLWHEYSNWGEDPFIIATEGDHDCSFSAWDYAKERIKHVSNNILEC